MVRRFLPHIRQHETHRQLIGRVGAISRRAPEACLDAIIVPASRQALNLDPAVTLARATRARLVVLCSRDALAPEVEGLLAARGFSDAVVAELPSGYSHPLLTFSTSDLASRELPHMCANPNGDLSTKRNLGLLLARMCRWRRIFFMDDDVRDVGAADLYATVAMLGRYRSVGIRVTDFPDNSVVCHAHRMTGAPQDVFVSGSALAVNCGEHTGFFPEIYNEDWLFFYDDVCERRLGWSGRNATQLRYDPFAQTRRAEQQEFGDVLAEGLYARLHRGTATPIAGQDYWDDFLAARRNLLDDILSRADLLASPLREKITSAVQTAMMCLMEIRPSTCERYVTAWRGDLRRWTETLSSISPSGSLESALGELMLTPAGGGALQLPTVSCATSLAPGPGSGTAHVPRVATLDLLPSRRKPTPGRGRHRKAPRVPGPLPTAAAAVTPGPTIAAPGPAIVSPLGTPGAGRGDPASDLPLA